MAFDTSVKVENKSGTRLDVSLDTVTVEDTSRSWDDSITLNSDVTLESSLTVGTIIEILSVNLACTDNNLFRVAVKDNIGTSDVNVLGMFYCTGSLSLIPNIRFTVPDSSNDDLVIKVQRLVGAGTANVGFSIIYRITPP